MTFNKKNKKWFLLTITAGERRRRSSFACCSFSGFVLPRPCTSAQLYTSPLPCRWCTSRSLKSCCSCIGQQIHGARLATCIPSSCLSEKQRVCSVFSRAFWRFIVYPHNSYFIIHNCVFISLNCSDNIASWISVIIASFLWIYTWSRVLVVVLCFAGKLTFHWGACYYYLDSSPYSVGFAIFKPFSTHYSIFLQFKFNWKAFCKFSKTRYSYYFKNLHLFFLKNYN